MTILNQLLPASFRGVSFYTSTSSMESGRKQITHEFPNSNRRFVEDLGRFQNIYKMSAIVSGTGFNYSQNKNALIEALEQEGIGQLVHPFYGSVQVVAKQFSVEEDITRLGEAIFTLTFEKSDPALVPIGDSNNLSNLGITSDNLLDILAGDIGNAFSLFNSYPNNYTDALSMVSLIGDAFGVNTTLFTQSISSINQFNALLDGYKASGNTLIAQPTQLGTETMNLYTQTDTLVTNPSERLPVYQKFYDFNDNQVPVNPTTFELAQRQSNREILNGSIQAGALVQSYRTAAQIDYGNIRELNMVQSLLETQYQKVIQNEAIPNTTKLAIQELRSQARLFFEAERLNVNQIESIVTKRQPLTILNYQYYGSVDNVPRIAALNKIRNNAFIEGPIDILTG